MQISSFFWKNFWILEIFLMDLEIIFEKPEKPYETLKSLIDRRVKADIVLVPHI